MFTHDERLGKDENINCTKCGSETAQFFDNGDVSLCPACYGSRDSGGLVDYIRQNKQVSCAHEETEVDEAVTGMADGNGDEATVAIDVCIKCGKDMGKHEPWTPDTLEEARS